MPTISRRRFALVLALLLASFCIFSGGANANDEEANRLIVTSVLDLDKSKDETDPRRRYELLKKIDADLKRIVSDFPSSKVAVQLVTEERVGKFVIKDFQNDLSQAERAVRHLDFEEVAIQCAKEPRRQCFIKAAYLLSQDIDYKDGGHAEQWQSLIFASARDGDDDLAKYFLQRLATLDSRYRPAGMAAFAAGKQDVKLISMIVTSLETLDPFTKLQVIDMLSRVDRPSADMLNGLLSSLASLLVIDHGFGDHALKSFVRLMPALVANKFETEVTTLIMPLERLRRLEARAAFVAVLKDAQQIPSVQREIDTLAASPGPRKDLTDRQITMAKAKLAVAFPRQMATPDVLAAVRIHPHRQEAALALAEIAKATGNSALYKEALALAQKVFHFDEALADIAFLARDVSPLAEAIEVTVKNVKTSGRHSGTNGMPFFAYCAERAWQ